MEKESARISEIRDGGPTMEKSLRHKDRSRIVASAWQLAGWMDEDLSYANCNYSTYPRVVSTTNRRPRLQRSAVSGDG